MSNDLSDKLAQLEATARRSSLVGTVLVACGLLVFISAIYYSSSQLSQMEKSLADKRRERDKLQIEVDKLNDEKRILDAYKLTSDASAQENKARLQAALPTPNPAEYQAAEVAVTNPERTRIDHLVENLFSHAPADRVAAYHELTTSELRAKDYSAEAILKRGNAELAKSPDQRNSIGLYNTIVTLTDMSRAVTQKPSIKSKIDEYADQVAQAFPQLRSRVDTLKRWLETRRS
jgi:hypothetical protein